MKIFGGSSVAEQFPPKADQPMAGAVNPYIYSKNIFKSHFLFGGSSVAEQLAVNITKTQLPIVISE